MLFRSQADGDTTDHGARDGADAAQHGGDECFQAQHGTHGGSSLRVRAAVQPVSYTHLILFNLIGEWIENGEYPNDEKALEKIVKGICFDNAKRYFAL